MDKETGSFWNCSLQKAVKQLIVRRVQILAETPDRPLVLPSLLVFPKNKIRFKLIRIMVEIKFKDDLEVLCSLGHKIQQDWDGSLHCQVTNGGQIEGRFKQLKAAQLLLEP